MAFDFDSDVDVGDGNGGNGRWYLKWMMSAVRWKDFDLWQVTHYCYDGLDLDFVNDDLDANRVKIVGTHDATIVETTAELMNLILSEFVCKRSLVVFWYYFFFVFVLGASEGGFVSSILFVCMSGLVCDIQHEQYTTEIYRFLFIYTYKHKYVSDQSSV